MLKKKYHAIHQTENAAIKKMLHIFGDHKLSSDRPPNIVQSYGMPESIAEALRRCLGDRNPSNRVRVMSAQRKSRFMDLSVGRSGTYKFALVNCIVVYHCAMAMSPKGPSRVPWRVTLKHVFSVAHRFGAPISAKQSEQGGGALVSTPLGSSTDTYMYN